MINAQQENGTDEAPERDVRWEGKLARLENKAHEYNRVGLDWKTVEVEASTLERILTEREAYRRAWRPVTSLVTGGGNNARLTSGMARLSPDEMDLR